MAGFICLNLWCLEVICLNLSWSSPSWSCRLGERNGEVSEAGVKPPWRFPPWFSSCGSEGCCAQMQTSHFSMSKARGEECCPCTSSSPLVNQAMSSAVPHCPAGFWQGSKWSENPSEKGAGKSGFHWKDQSLLWFCERSGTKFINELLRKQALCSKKELKKNKNKNKRKIKGK